MTDTLLQIRDRLQTQDQLLSQLQDGTCTDCEPILDQTRDMLHTQLRQVEDGLADPQGFIYRHRNQARSCHARTDRYAEVPVQLNPMSLPRSRLQLKVPLLLRRNPAPQLWMVQDYRTETWEHLSRRMAQALDQVNKILMLQPSRSRMEQKMVPGSKVAERMSNSPVPESGGQGGRP